MSASPVRDLPVAIAVPAHNEAELVSPMLRALDVAAEQVPGADVRVVLLVNNDRERTADIARQVALEHVALEIVEVSLPPARAHAGGARQLACDLAADGLPDHGVLLTTDADSRVAPDWLRQNLAEIVAGAEAVAGSIAFDCRLPPRLQREWELAALQAELVALLDPMPYDPWPTHRWSWGASLAITKATFTRIGGMPNVPLAEDRHFTRACEGYDVKLRYSCAARVWTSARCDGRAEGGMAALFEAHGAEGPAPCDALLEPLSTLLPRVRARAAARAAWPDPARLGPIVRGAGARFPHMSATFGGWWHLVEASVWRWRKRRLKPAELTREIRRARTLVTALRGEVLKVAA